jgi:type I restriction enzyme, S subunit
MKFRGTTLREISGGGTYGLGAAANHNLPSPKFLRTTDIVSGSISWDTVPSCEASDGDIIKYLLQDGDIVISRTGANAGINCLISNPPKDAIFAGYLVRFRIPANEADSRFVSYVLQSQSWQDYVDATRTGSAQPQLNAVLMGNFELSLPELKIQTEIADILESLDEKIRVNQQIASTLEQIAQTIFRSWFVDFDPVHAKARGEQPVGMDAETSALFPDSFEDSELGPIPSGWHEKSLGDICDLFDSKRVPLAKDVRASRPGPFPYYGATGALDAIDDFIFDGIYVLVAEDGTVMTAEGTPVIQYVWGKFWVSNHAHILKGRDSMSDEQLMLLLQRVKLEQYVTGAVQMKVSQGNLKSIPVVVAPSAINSCFSKLIEPLYAQIRTLKDQNQSLMSIRDSLLPRLISGELEIPAELLEA